MLLLYLAVGGALGTVARFTVAGWVYDRAAEGFPWGTLAVNAAGSLLIGFVLRLLDVMTVTPEMRGFLTIGLLGGFTTFSTYTWETVTLARDGQWVTAGTYALGSLFVGLFAVLFGVAVATLLIRMRTLQ
ncbi:MAG: fluoride efflux transporter CrcB [Gemmatimonadota bacterium]